jgi:fructokinase
MGTGVGGGLVFERKAWDGAQGIAGEWGHVVLDPTNGPPCYCGKRGCVETYLSGPAIERAYRERTGRDGVKLPEIAKSDDGRAFLVERMDVFGRALATVIDIVDPDVVVLGGGVSNLEVLYDEGIVAVRRWVFNDALETRIVKHALGDSAGVFGAALL